MADNRNSFLSILLLIVLSGFIFSFAYKIWKPMDYSKIKIAVLNGCGVDDLASDTSKFLRKEGFDVTFFGNAAENQERTVIVDKLTEKKKWASIVGKKLGITNLSYSVDSSRCLNVVIILGNDYKEVLPDEILNRRLIGI